MFTARGSSKRVCTAVCGTSGLTQCHGALQVLTSAEKARESVPDRERSMFTLLYHRPLIQEVSAQGMESWPPPSLGKGVGDTCSFITMDVGAAGGQAFKWSTQVTSCSQEVCCVFLKVWLIHGGVGACMMLIEIHTSPSAVSDSSAHRRRSNFLCLQALSYF